MSFKDTAGKHISFYYFGYNHLFINLLKYCQAGVNNHELIYISMNHSLFSKINEALISLGIPGSEIRFLSVRDLILSSCWGGIDGLKDTIDRYEKEARKLGYQGIRWIGQPSHAIRETSKNSFLAWEKDLTAGFLNTNSTMLCIYDFEDYISLQDIIDEEIIRESFSSHSHLLQQFSLKEVMS